MTAANAARPQGRLQRSPDWTGGRLETFRAVVLRHGLPGALLGMLGLVVALNYPPVADFARCAITPAAAEPLRYLLGGLILLALFCLHAWRRRCLNPPQLAWTVYLGGLSLWEEWVFRLLAPYAAVALGADPWLSLLAANICFGLLHYVTLRWKWYWCACAGLGGLALSLHFETNFDLLWIAALHWIGTFLNTPQPPSGTAD
ncbi:MAG: hypothetical protein AAF515_08845 [Pseudomonadota bacterium]